MENPSPGLGGVIRCRSLHRMQLHVSLCGTTVVGSSLENSALSGKLELKLRSRVLRIC